MQFMPFFINHNLPHLDSRQTFEKIAHDTAGNMGNAYITYSLARLCGINHRTIQGIGNIWVDIENIDKNKADEINSNHSHVVMIMQDQIREHDSYYAAIPFDKINDFIESIKIPFIVVSLGHNSFGFSDYDHQLHSKIPAGLIKMLSILSHKCLQIGVRGIYTADILNRIGINNIAVVGCPSIFSPGPQRVIIKKKIWNSHLKIGLTGAVTHKDDLPNAYSIFQDINESFFIKLAHYPNELTHEDFTHLLSMPNNIRIPLLKQLMNGRGKFFVDLAQWELFTSKLDFVVGSRMHGAIVSLNGGVPAVVTSGDSRAREMCELFCIPLFAGRDDIKTIYKEADFTQFNQSYKKLYTQFMDFLSQNIGHRPVPLSEGRWHNRIIKSISKQSNIDLLRH